MPHTIAENLTRLSNAKDAIAAAIVDKGGTIEAGDGFESFADKIEAISGGGGVLISKNITENGTYYAVDDEADGYASVEVDVASGKYNEINCTMQEYEAMESHNIHTIYIVTDGNKTYKYLGNDQIGFEEIPITDRAILSNGKGYECRDELNVSGYNPIDWGKDWELILAFVLTTSSLPSAFSNKQYLCGSTNSYPANVRNPFMEWTNSYITLMYSTDGGSSWPNCGYLDNDNYSTFISLLDPTKGITNYIKVKHTSGSQHHYDWLHSKDGRKYTKFYECDRTGYPSAIAASGTHFTFGFGDTKNITQGNGFWMLYDRCALYSEGNLIFGREVIPSAKSFPPNIEALEYIKSEGNSVILTDILPDYDWEVHFDMMIENVHYNGNDIFFGTRKSVESSEHFLMAFGFGQNWSTYTAWSGFTPTGQDTISVNDITNGVGKRQCCIMRRGNAKCIFGDKSFKMTEKTTDDTPVTPIGIAGFDSDDPNEYGVLPYSKSDMTIYGITLLDENDTVIYNFIPAQNKTTERAGLYDLVNGIFYPSSSDFDDFIKGPKVFSTPSVDATLVTKTITEDGIYNAVSDNADGYSSITVNTPAPDDIEIYGIMNSNWWWHDNNEQDYLVRAEDKDNTAPARAALIAGTIIRVPRGCRAEISCDKSSLQMSCYHLNPDGSGHSTAFPGGWQTQPMVIDNRTGTEDYFLAPHIRKSDDTSFSSSELPTKVIVHYTK